MSAVAIAIAVWLTAPADPVYETVVRASSSPEAVDALPFATTTVDETRVRNGRQESTLADALIAVPGVAGVNRDNLAQDLRLSIRGFGARSSFGVRGITIIVDGIPQSLADGQAQVDAIDPSVLGRLQVMRGAAGALYGNGAGGVMLMDTTWGQDGVHGTGKVVYGSYDTLKLVGLTTATLADTDVHASVSHFSTVGYREHSAGQTTNARLKARHHFDADTTLSLTLAFTHAPYADDPGALTRDEVLMDPRMAAPTSLEFDTGERLDELQSGVAFSTAITDTQTIEASAFYTRRVFGSYVPSRTVDFDRDYYGVSARYAARPMAHTVGVGIDVRQQRDARTNDTNVGGSAGAPRLVDQIENVRSLGAYVHATVRLHERLSLLGSVRHDVVRFSVDDALSSGSGRRTFAATTALGGIVAQLHEAASVYANIAQSFQTPTTTELVQSSGGLNRDVDPERATSTEIGVRGRVGELRYDAAAYWIRLRDELVPFRDASMQTFYRNAARSRRLGVEASVTASPITGVTIAAAATFLDARYSDYERDGTSFNGNRVPGIEPLRLGMQAQYTAPFGTFAGLDAQYIAHAQADDANTATNRTTLLLDTRIGHRHPLGPLHLEAFLGIRNATNAHYDENTRLNAATPRYFEPATPRTYYAGAALNF